MSTIYDIAKATGISVSTVARALRGTGYCSQEKREIILKAAEAMNYSPIHAAKSLKTGRTNKILYCVPNIDNVFYLKSITGVTHVLEKHQFLPLLCYTRQDLELELRMIQNLSEHYGDGLIMITTDVVQPILDAIGKCGMPVVMVNKMPQDILTPNLDVVYTDVTAGTKIATRHLIDLGHRKIGYIGGPLDISTGLSRYTGYREAMREAELPILEQYHYYFNYEENVLSGGQIDFTDLPTAFICANDQPAISLMRVCQRHGISIPNDLSIIGMDNLEMCTYLSPELTSVDLHHEQLGRLAAEILMDRIMNGRTISQMMSLQPKLVLRETVAPPRAGVK